MHESEYDDGKIGNQINSGPIGKSCIGKKFIRAYEVAHFGRLMHQQLISSPD
jgi:hypothetical protein